MSVTRPVLFLTGRQHGNEVSSTSHILQLVEWLASEDEGQRLLERVNLIVQPMTNPDGADLAYELSQATPDFMLHAGYTGCLGTDVTRDQWARDPLYPESRIRRELWELWRPDVVLDPHGYPSHEWVQLFGGHAAWFRSRHEIRRDWWIPRGAFIPNFEVVRDPHYPHHESTSCAIRDRIARALSDSMADVNERMYARYRKYVSACGMPLPWETHAGLLVYPSGSVDPKTTAASKAPKQSFMTRHPEVTVFQSAIELPDETARGEWLERLTRAGFEASLACVRFLSECEYKVTRSRLEDEGRTMFRIDRPRPVRPPGVST
jgi:hypothetical protein